LTISTNKTDSVLVYDEKRSLMENSDSPPPRLEATGIGALVGWKLFMAGFQTDASRVTDSDNNHKTDSVLVYDEKRSLMENSDSPPPSPVPEIRITFPAAHPFNVQGLEATGIGALVGWKLFMAGFQTDASRA
jgi:hypothetical protein